MTTESDRLLPSGLTEDEQAFLDMPLKDWAIGYKDNPDLYVHRGWLQRRVEGVAGVIATTYSNTRELIGQIATREPETDVASVAS